MCHVTQAACVRNQGGCQLGTYLGAHTLRLQIRNTLIILESNQYQHWFKFSHLLFARENCLCYTSESGPHLNFEQFTSDTHIGGLL